MGQSIGAQGTVNQWKLIKRESCAGPAYISTGCSIRLNSTRLKAEQCISLQLYWHFSPFGAQVAYALTGPCTNNAIPASHSGDKAGLIQLFFESNRLAMSQAVRKSNRPAFWPDFSTEAGTKCNRFPCRCTLRFENGERYPIGALQWIHFFTIDDEMFIPFLF